MSTAIPEAVSDTGTARLKPAIVKDGDFGNKSRAITNTNWIILHNEENYVF